MTTDQKEKQRAYQREWARKRMTAIRATETPQEREQRLQKKRKSDAASYQRHKKERLSQAAEYREANREEIRKRDAKYRKNPKRRAYMLKYLHEYREQNREAMAEAHRIYYQKNRARLDAYKRSTENILKVNARRFLRAAVAQKVVFKPEDCEGCGQPTPRRELQGHHHRGYDHPLDVQWLCSVCHGKTRRS